MSSSPSGQKPTGARAAVDKNAKSPTHVEEISRHGLEN